MCGRFVSNFSTSELVAFLEDSTQQKVVFNVADQQTLFNAAPSQMLPVVIARNGCLDVQLLQWGLSRSWASKNASNTPMINARAETVHEKPSFRDLVAKNRCIVPMRGFFEWGTTPEKFKRPFYIRRQDEQPALVAGLYSPTAGPLGMPMFVVITREASDDVSEIHHRSPAIIERDMICNWLSGEPAPLSLLTSKCESGLRYHAVSTQVNSVRNQDEGLLTPIEPEQLF